ncbi:MAG: hypothetical protein QW429_02290 [Thermoprotei archaeon]
MFINIKPCFRGASNRVLETNFYSLRIGLTAAVAPTDFQTAEGEL